MCPYPIYIEWRDLYVPCGKCGACVKRAISDWVARCQFEIRKSLHCYFVTLTYEKDPTQFFIDNFSEDYNPFKHQLQKYFKRLRKERFEFSYFALGDYGDTYGRPHYHVIFFSKGFFDPDRIHELWCAGDKVCGRGFVDVKEITVGRIAYVVRYGFLARLDWDRSDSRPKPFFLMSKRPAIGAGYLSKVKKAFHLNNQFWYWPDGVFKKSLPRYWRDRIFVCPCLRKCHSILLAFEQNIVKDVELGEFRSQFPTLNPVEKWIERRQRNADNYLSRLRKQKQLKNKLL